MIALLISASENTVFGQAKKRKPKPVSVIVELPNRYSTPLKGQLVYLVNIDKDSKITVSLEKAGTSPVIATSEELDSLFKFFYTVNAKAEKYKPYSVPIVIRSDQSLRYETILKSILVLREASEQRVYVETSTLSYLIVPQKPEANTKPNPLTLWVSLDESLNLKLNREDEGNLSNPSDIQNRLSRVFKEREDDGVFREGTNEIEKTVFIKPDPHVKFREIANVADKLKIAGAWPIGLMVDDWGYKE
jgi:biopolymer transport protein ExbD